MPPLDEPPVLSVPVSVLPAVASPELSTPLVVGASVVVASVVASVVVLAVIDVIVVVDSVAEPAVIEPSLEDDPLLLLSPVPPPSDGEPQASARDDDNRVNVAIEISFMARSSDLSGYGSAAARASSPRAATAIVRPSGQCGANPRRGPAPIDARARSGVGSARPEGPMAIDDQQPPEGEDEGLGRESHRERTIRMRAIAALANTLVGMKPPQLAAVGLPEEIAEAVVACQGFKKNARARQLRRIGGLLRAADLAPIEAGVREAQTGKGERSRREQTYEIWRTQLLTGGGAAMTAFVTAHPGADVQALRQRVRMATREPESPRGKGAARELLRMIRVLGEATLAAKLAGAASSADEPDADEPDDAPDADAPDDDAPDDDAVDEDDADDEPDGDPSAS